MDPITIAILSATAGTAISSLPSLIGGKQHRSNKKRLEELEKRRAAGGLGLSGKEEAAMSGKLRSTADQASEQMEQRQKQLLAGGGQASGGQALASAVGLQQERMGLESEVNQQILEADEAEKQRELEELYGLEAAVAEKRNQRVQAVANIAGSDLVQPHNRLSFKVKKTFHQKRSLVSLVNLVFQRNKQEEFTKCL